MAVTQSFSLDELTDERLTKMFQGDGRTRSNFLQWLINKEWEGRSGATEQKEAAELLPTHEVL